MLRIRLADSSDYSNIRDFYYSLIEAMEKAEYKPGWKKDIYPTQEFLTRSIKNHELYVGEIDEWMVSAMVVNH